MYFCIQNKTSMKKLLVWCAALIIGVAASAQDKKQDWKEMHSFHGVMSKTFHPAEEGNVAPLKENATALVQKAKEWQSSTVPQGYNGSVTKPILAKLVKQCESIDKAVKKGKKDDELVKMITQAHDIFHEIMEKCKDEKH
jgi:hypothetical protein